MQQTPENVTGGGGPPEDVRDLRMKLAVQKAIIQSQQRGFKVGDNVGYSYDLKIYSIKAINGSEAAVKPLFPGGGVNAQNVLLEDLYHTDILEQLLAN